MTAHNNRSTEQRGKQTGDSVSHFDWYTPHVGGWKTSGPLSVVLAERTWHMLMRRTHSAWTPMMWPLMMSDTESPHSLCHSWPATVHQHPDAHTHCQSLTVHQCPVIVTYQSLIHPLHILHYTSVALSGWPFLFMKHNNQNNKSSQD